MNAQWVQRRIEGAMHRWGISPARLIRRAAIDGISASQVRRALRGEGAAWTDDEIERWDNLIATAWTTPTPSARVPRNPAPDPQTLLPL